jgi:hypothetical protein
MKKRQRKKLEKQKNSIQKRCDSMVGASTGRGTSTDKLARITPKVRTFAPSVIRNWYRSNGFIQNIIDAPADDAVKNWINIKTNRDNDNEDLPGLGISRLIINRMDELGLRKKISDLIRFSRMYEEGGFMYMGIISDKPQMPQELAFPIPAIDKIDFINVFGPEKASVRTTTRGPLSKNYHTRKYLVDGIEVHESRLFHLVRKYLPEDERGISVISTILDPIIGQDTALWSISSLVYEMAVWVLKSPEFKTMPASELADTLSAAKEVMSSQAFMGIADDEELQRIAGTDAGKGFIKEAVDVIFENLAGMSQMPKSRLMGQSQGVITSGQFDLRGYYESVETLQEQEIRPILYTIIDRIINERKGEIYSALGGDTSSLDWEIEFNPLWIEDPTEETDRKLKVAQSDQIYITTAVLSPSEVKGLRFSELEEFDEWENQPLSFTTPTFEDDTTDKEKDKKDDEKDKK